MCFRILFRISELCHMNVCKDDCSITCERNGKKVLCFLTISVLFPVKKAISCLFNILYINYLYRIFNVV